MNCRYDWFSRNYFLKKECFPSKHDKLHCITIGKLSTNIIINNMVKRH